MNHVIDHSRLLVGMTSLDSYLPTLLSDMELGIRCRPGGQLTDYELQEMIYTLLDSGITCKEHGGILKSDHSYSTIVILITGLAYAMCKLGSQQHYPDYYHELNFLYLSLFNTIKHHIANNINLN